MILFCLFKGRPRRTEENTTSLFTVDGSATTPGSRRSRSPAEATTTGDSTNRSQRLHQLRAQHQKRHAEQQRQSTHTPTEQFEYEIIQIFHPKKKKKKHKWKFFWFLQVE
jgi:hypothetical protein